jgi:hypothetical protein
MYGGCDDDVCDSDVGGVMVDEVGVMVEEVGVMVDEVGVMVEEVGGLDVGVDEGV